MRPATFLAILLAAGVARAQSDDAKAQAQKLFDSGTAHYNLAEYDAAISDYKEAYRLLPDPLFLLDIGQAYRQLDECDQAATFYRSYLRNAPQAANADKVKKWIGDMDVCAKEEDPVGEIESEAWGGRPGRFSSMSTSTSTLTTTYQIPEARVEYGAVHDVAQPKLPSWISVGVGVAAVGAGGYFSWRANHDASEVASRCANGCDGMDITALDSQGHASERDAAISYAVGGVAVFVAALLYLHPW